MAIKPFDRALFLQWVTQTLDAVSICTAKKLNRKLNATREDAIETFISFLAGAMVCAACNRPDDYQAHRVAAERYLRIFDREARRFLAAAHKQPFVDEASDKHQELNSLRKSLGRLYGMVKDMERAAE